MGSKRLKHNQARGTGPLDEQGAEPKRGTAPLKGKTGELRRGTGPVKSKYSTAQLRLPPSKRRKRRRFTLISMLRLMGIGAVAASAVGLVGAYSVLDSLGVKDGRGQKLGALEFVQGLMPLTERQQVLILGADISYAGGRRIEGGPTRSDTILVAGVDPAAARVNVVSIPRDTRVLVRGRYDKINSAMALGGPKLTASVVSNLLGVKVDRWIQVDTDGLMRIVDMMGGVRVHVDKDMRYVDRTAKLRIDLKAGDQVLSGEQAHGFVRFRHDGMGDIGRVQRQQQFVLALARQALSPTTLFKAPQLLAAVQSNIHTNMSGAELMRLALFGPRLPRENVKMVMLPGEFSSGRFAASYWLADPVQASALGARLFAGAKAQVGDRARLKVTVLNGTPHPGVAMDAARTLRQAGWNVWSIGDAASRDHRRTQVIAQTGHDELAPALGSALGVQAEPVKASVGDLLTDFTVIVGTDFDGKPLHASH